MPKIRKFKRVKLPTVPSALIRLALKDLKAVEKMEEYSVNMATWHDKNNGEYCEVCFAGAVMARTLEVSIDSAASPSGVQNRVTAYFPQTTNGKLDALDDFREGNCEAGFTGMRLDSHKGVKFNRHVPLYNIDDPKQFHDAMRKLARDLKKAGY